jgi:hypothetical protein
MRINWLEAVVCALTLVGLFVLAASGSGVFGAVG